MAEADETVKERRPGAAVPTPQPTEVDVLSIGTTIERYVIGERLGEGGMGVVYAGYDFTLDRRVAIKLVRDGGDDVAQERLIGEAQAMAKLDHPAIVTVHDVGTFRGQVFIAIEYVDGPNLRAWLAARPRRWQDIVAVLCAAGEGLAHAHAAGVVHRDFKSDNVLMTDDDRPIVTDFGLAKVVPAKAPTAMDLVRAAAARPNATPALTFEGTGSGTPGYMPPEQAEGRATDARSDQYSFCVTAFEALNGHRPDEPVARADRVLGRPPARIAAAIQRGLASDPDQRWPTLDALLAELAPRRTARWWIAGGAAMVAAGAAALLIATRGDAPRGPTCGLAATRLAGVWDASRSTSVRAAFVRDGAAAATNATPVIAAADGWTRQWVDMAEASCQATSRGEQSATLHDRRTQCLGHALLVVGGMVDVLATGDAGDRGNAEHAIRALPSVERCADAEALVAADPPPVDPDRRAAHDALEVAITKAEALGLFGELTKSNEALRAAGARATTLEDWRLVADVAHVIGDNELMRGGDGKAVVAAAYQAIAAGERSGDARIVTVGWAMLSRAADQQQHDPDTALAIAEIVRARIERATHPEPRMMAALEDNVGLILDAKGKYPEARAHLQHALELREQNRRDGDGFERVLALEHLAQATNHAGDQVTRGRLLDQARELAEHELGPDHQATIAAIANQGLFAYNQKDLPKARQYLEQAYERGKRILGDTTQGEVLMMNLGVMELKSDELDKSEQHLTTALQMAEHLETADSGRLQKIRVNLGAVMQQRKQFDAAERYYRLALDATAKLPDDVANGPHYVARSTLHYDLANIAFDQHHFAEAEPLYRKSLALYTKAAADPKVAVEIQLAKTLWELGRDRKAAVAAMTAARDEAQASGAHDHEDEASTWLAAHHL